MAASGGFLGDVRETVRWVARTEVEDVRTAPCIDVAEARRTVDREAERVEAIVDLAIEGEIILGRPEGLAAVARREFARKTLGIAGVILLDIAADRVDIGEEVDRKSTRLNSSH